MQKIKTAVVGVGYLGKFHAQKLKQIKGSELLFVVDSSKESGQAVAKDLGVEYLPDYQQLKGKVDAVTVAATTSAHYEITKFLLNNGIHVNVEKPITSTTSEARELCDLAEKNNLKLQVGHVERFNPVFQEVQSKLENPLFIECHRLAPFKPRGVDVSVVLDLMIHDLDVILSLVKQKVVKVSACGTPVLTSTTDIASARLEFEGGCTANITASRVSINAQRKFRVFQKNQYLSLDFGGGEVNLVTKVGEFDGDNLPIETESWNLEKGDALLAENQAFVDAIINDTQVPVTGRHGLEALELAEQIINEIKQTTRN